MSPKTLLWLVVGLLLAIPAWAETVAAPSSLTAPPTDPDGGYSIIWTPSTTGGAQYLLEEATDPGFAESTVVYQGKATRTNLKGRLAGYTYHYRVKATLTGFDDSDWVVAGNGCAVPYRVQVKTAKGGTITPNGLVEVPVGATQTVAITPEVGYHVASVVVDGVELGEVTSVTVPDALVPNSKNKHAIKVKFAVNSYQVTATAGEGGSITPVGTKTFKHGKQATYTIKPNSGQTITSLLVNGQEVLPSPLPSGVYKLPVKVETATTIQAYFLQAAPPADLGVPASDDDGGFTVNWSASTTEGVSYRLEEATDSDFTSNLRTAYSGPDTSAPITGRSAGTTYYYRVKAVKAGLADSSFVSADNGCQCVALPVTDEGLLKGDAGAPALSVITFYNAITGVPAEEIGIEISGVQVALTELEIEFADGTTVGEVNTVLASIDGKITFLLDGVPIILVRIPNPGSVAALDALVAQLESDPAVRLVRKGYFPAADALPDNHAELDSLNYIAHQLAVRAHGAWNVRSLLNSVISPRLVVADYFGGGAPGGDYSLWLANSSEFGSAASDEHGYHVLGIIAADYDDETSNVRQRITGIYPSVLTLSVVDLQKPFDDVDGAHLTWPAIEDLILVQVRNAPGKTVVNTSIGFPCETPGGVEQLCNNLMASAHGYEWVRKVREGGFEHKFIHVTSAGNIDVAGDTSAKFDSPFTAARLLVGEPTATFGTPPLTNTLVIENVVATGSPPQPRCLNGRSKYHGDLSAVGTNVWSLTGGVSFPETMTGTSMAAPQVAGLAAYVWALNPLLTNLEVIEILKDTARMVELNVGADPSCGAIPPARVIDAYAAVLASDTTIAQAKVRRELLDVADGSGAPGSNGTFDEKDVQLLVDILDVQNGILDYSRYDLNGDGRTGGDTVERFDLNLDRVYTITSQTIDDEEIEFSETAASDDDVLCFYAYSPLYDGVNDARENILKGRCGLGKIEVVIGASGPDQYVIGASDNHHYVYPTWTGVDLSPEGGVPLMSVGPGCEITGGDIVVSGESRQFQVAVHRTNYEDIIDAEATLDVQANSRSALFTFTAGATHYGTHTAAFSARPVEPGSYLGLIHLLVENFTRAPISLEASWNLQANASLVCERAEYYCWLESGIYINARASGRDDARLYCDTPTSWQLVPSTEGEPPTHDIHASVNLDGIVSASVGDSATDSTIVPIPPGRHLLTVFPFGYISGSNWLDLGLSSAASVYGTVMFQLKR